MESPIVLQAVYQTRVWGGRSLQTLYGRDLPGDDSVTIGESWDVVDRPEEQSVVIAGPYAGQTLGDLWTERREEVFGSEAPERERFPLLCKILDVNQNLSIQVHPPARVAGELGGEAKSEFWYAAMAKEDALWYAGLKTGITREAFEQSMRAGATPECLHQMSVSEGLGLYVPSGKVHALGAGQMIFEIQENSDTAFRVFDWEREAGGAAGRELHVDAALRSIDFEDWEARPVTTGAAGGCLVESPEFRVEKIVLSAGRSRVLSLGFAVMAVVLGGVICGGHAFKAGDYFLLPANEVAGMGIEPSSPEGASLLRVTWP